MFGFFFSNRMASPADLIKVHVQMEGRRRLLGLPPRVHGSADALKQILNVVALKHYGKVVYRIQIEQL